MSITVDKINKSQSVAHSKISPSAIGVMTALSFCSPVIATTNNDIHNSSERRIHTVKIREVGVNQTISIVNKKIQAVDFNKPNSKTMEITKKIVGQFGIKNIPLDFLNPSHDGGMILEFHIGNDYHLIELFNDGDIVLLKRNNQRNQREVFDLDEKSLFEFVNSL